MKLLSFVLLGIMAMGAVIEAAELADVEMPDTISIGEKTVYLNGQGLRKKMWFKVYVGGLYLEEASSDPDTILASGQAWRVTMHFLHGEVGVDKLNGAWIDGFKKNTPGSLETFEKEIDQFTSMFRTVVKHEEIWITYLPGEGLSVVIEGEEKGKIVSDEFATAVLAIWLGPKPPSDDLKEGMLGLKD